MMLDFLMFSLGFLVGVCVGMFTIVGVVAFLMVKKKKLVRKKE